MAYRPGISDIYIYQGDDWDYFFRIRDKLTQEYINFTNHLVLAQIRVTATTTEILGEMVGTIPDQTNPELLGGVLLQMGRAATALLPPTTQAVWDVETTGPGIDGKRQTWLRGKATVEAQVSRP